MHRQPVMDQDHGPKGPNKEESAQHTQTVHDAETVPGFTETSSLIKGSRAGVICVVSDARKQLQLQRANAQDGHEKQSL